MRIAPLVVFTLGVAALAVCFLGLSGCAVGRDPLTGRVIFGADLGVLAETTNQAVVQAVNTFLPGMGTLVTAGVTAIGGAGTLAVGWARSHAAAVAAKAEKNGEDRGWSDAVSHHSVPPVIPAGGGDAPVDPPTAPQT